MTEHRDIVAKLSEGQRKLMAGSWAGFDTIPADIQVLNAAELMHIDVIKGSGWLRWKARPTPLGQQVRLALKANMEEGKSS
jgi:hypothetical protein